MRDIHNFGKFGDGNSEGKIKIRVTNGHKSGIWTQNGNGAWENGVDYAYSFGENAINEAQ